MVLRTPLLYRVPGKAVYYRYARLFEVQKWILFAPSVRHFIFEFPCMSVESYARLSLYICKNEHLTFFVLYGHHTYHVPGTRYRYVSGIYTG